jgi:hypothetical protein
MKPQINADETDQNWLEGLAVIIGYRSNGFPGGCAESISFALICGFILFLFVGPNRFFTVSIGTAY